MRITRDIQVLILALLNICLVEGEMISSQIIFFLQKLLFFSFQKCQTGDLWIGNQVIKRRLQD